MPKLSSEVSGIVNQTIKNMPMSGIRGFDNKVSQIPGILKLTLGEPDFNVPEHIKQAAIRGIQNDDSHYAPSNGKLELRQAIAKRLKESRGVDYDPENEIIVTNGATEGLGDIMLGALNPGDEVLVPTPAFSLYFSVIRMAGAKVVEMDTFNNGFELTTEQVEQALEEHPNAKMILLNYPSNPTGRVYSQEKINELAALFKKHHILVVADEIYSDLEYDQKHASLATLIPGQTLLVSGASKSFAMTGWRIGFIAGPAELLAEITKVHSFLTIAVNDIAQDAAIEAYEHGKDDPAKFNAAYKKRRDFLIEKLTEMGFEMATPEGAFYVFAKIPAKFGKDDEKFALALAQKAKVGVVPGNVFGEGGKGYIRISYAASDEKLSQAMQQIKEHLSELQ